MAKLAKRFLLLLLGLVMGTVVCTTSASVYAAPNTTGTYSNLNSTRGKLSFYFQDIDIRTLLQLIAKSSGLNFIISDAVKGNMTLNLKNVTWEQALNIILQSRGLAQRQAGNVIFISTIEELSSNEAKQMQSVQSIENLAPLTTRIIRLKYTNAESMAAILKGAQSQLLTTRGQVGVDARTNSIIIRDTRTSLVDVVPKIKSLDVPARQVLIEARIVNIDTQFEQELGVKFGMTRPTHLTGTLEGANSMQQGADPANVTNIGGTPDYTKRLNFNIPAGSIFGSPAGSIGMALGRIGNILLDLELSALEGERHAQIISSPRVVTSNQQKALIQAGEEIPYQEATSSGATSVTFKKAVLSLEITPQITPDNRVVLTLKATEDTRGESINLGGGSTVPAINTQQVESNVLLNNNETIVLGGIYRQNKENTVTRVPIFGSLPLVGYLFRHTNETDRKRELLIFITPKIINSKLQVAENGLPHVIHVPLAPASQAAGLPHAIYKDNKGS